MDLDDRRLDRAAALADVVRRAQDLTLARPALASVLARIDSPDVDARQIAQLAHGDSALSSSLIKAGNSAYYGLSGKVSNVQFAVIVMGLGSVRALAAAALLTAVETPPAWQAQSVWRAVASGRAASYVGADPSDSFCAGLVADIGRSLLRSVDPEAHAAMEATVEHPDDLEVAEVAWCDTTHSEVAASLFGQWHFPAAMIEAILGHHHGVTGSAVSPLQLAVRLGQDLVVRHEGLPPREDLGELTSDKIADDDLPDLLVVISEQAAELQSVLVA